eukprot:2854919-Amphidinium_carterae.5
MPTKRLLTRGSYSATAREGVAKLAGPLHRCQPGPSQEHAPCQEHRHVKELQSEVWLFGRQCVIVNTLS